VSGFIDFVMLLYVMLCHVMLCVRLSI